MQRRWKKELARCDRAESAANDFPSDGGYGDTTAGWPHCSLCGGKSQVVYASLPQIGAAGIVCEGCALKHGIDLGD
jgi:hypothetical protein